MQKAGFPAGKPAFCVQNLRSEARYSAAGAASAAAGSGLRPTTRR